MKRVQIEQMFTEKVAEYINKGYFISSTMSGHQGEINKVDLVKGKELIRVWLNSESAGSWLDDDAFHGNKVVLRVSKWKYEYSPKIIEGTVWMSDLETIEEISFYEISRNRWYVETLEEAKEIQNIHRERMRPYHTSEYKDITSEKTQEIGVRYLKNHEGYQRVSRDAIRIKKYIGRTGHISYKLYYKSNYYVIG